MCLIAALILVWNSVSEPVYTYAVTVLTEQESNWVSELASRLRLIQADAVTSTPEKRREFLQEEVARNFKPVAPANRKRFLEALLARFPVAGQIVNFSPAATAPAPAPTAAPAPESVDQTLERFLGAASNLSEDKRAEYAKRLSDAGFMWVDRDALVLEVSDELRQKLGLQGGQQPHLTRLVELAVFLVDALSQLDRSALKTMQSLSPRSPLLKRSEEFRSAAARFLVSENESLEPQWREMRGLLGGLLAALQGGGKDFGRQYIERLSPSAIEDVVASEGGGSMIPGLGKNKKERCWDRYTDLAGDYATPDLIDRRIRDCLAAFAEKAGSAGR